MIKMSVAALASTILFTAAPLLAHAASGPELVIDLQVKKIVRQKDGTETMVDGQAGPGDTLEYRATYTNRGAASAHGVLATLPVPPDSVEYVDASAAPVKVLASLDGKQFAPAPLQRVVVLSDGSRKSEAVPASEYRFLRWNLGDLDAGKSVVVRSRMRLIGAPY